MELDMPGPGLEWQWFRRCRRQSQGRVCLVWGRNGGNGLRKPGACREAQEGRRSRGEQAESGRRSRILGIVGSVCQ